MTTLDTHEHDTDGKFGSCRRCFTDAVEAEHAAVIDYHRDNLHQALNNAARSIEIAMSNIRKLREPGIYDVEVSEGTQGEQALSALSTATVLIQGVKAIMPEAGQ